VHVYLTYPFVLSWSLLEAMSAGCVVVGSRTPPVEEVVTDLENGLLVDFFDVGGLADRVCSVLADRDATASIREAARNTVVSQFDLKTACRPAHLALIGRLTGTAARPSRRRTERSRKPAEALIPAR
jgi:glycosyltransferase involved in cell wall biosynthesis